MINFRTSLRHEKTKECECRRHIETKERRGASGVSGPRRGGVQDISESSVGQTRSKNK